MSALDSVTRQHARASQGDVQYGPLPPDTVDQDTRDVVHLLSRHRVDDETISDWLNLNGVPCEADGRHDDHWTPAVVTALLEHERHRHEIRDASERNLVQYVADLRATGMDDDAVKDRLKWWLGDLLTTNTPLGADHVGGSNVLGLLEAAAGTFAYERDSAIGDALFGDVINEVEQAVDEVAEQEAAVERRAAVRRVEREAAAARARHAARERRRDAHEARLKRLRAHPVLTAVRQSCGRLAALCPLCLRVHVATRAYGMTAWRSASGGPCLHADAPTYVVLTEPNEPNPGGK